MKGAIPNATDLLPHNSVQTLPLENSPSSQKLATGLAVKLCPSVAQSRREVRLGKYRHKRCRLSSLNQGNWNEDPTAILWFQMCTFEMSVPPCAKK